MEIQIPVADQDTASESQTTDRTGYQTIPDNWSQEGHPSTAALTSRSRAFSSASQPTLGLLTEEEDVDNEDKDKDGFADLDSVDNLQASVCENTVDSENPRNGGGEDGDMKEANRSETSHRSAGSAVEEITEENVLEPESRADAKEESGGDETEKLPQETQENQNTEQKENRTEPEEIIDEACDSNSQEAQNDDAKSLTDQTPEEEDKNSNDVTKPDSEKDGKVFLTENDNLDEGSDISDVRAETPDWAEEDGEGKEGGSLSDEDEVARKPSSVSVNSQVRPMTRSTLHEDIAPGQRAVVNTPVSYYTTTDLHPETIRNIESRNTSHAGVESAREAAFQRAMTLMSSRCESKQEKGGEGGLFGSDDDTYGYRYPQYFYVHQRKPAPMAPLKAWKGYHGNVYFEPIQIAKVGGEGQETSNPPPSAMSRMSLGSRQRSMTATTRSQVMVPVPSSAGKDSTVRSRADTQSPTRSATRQTLRRGATSAKSATSSRSIAAMSQQHVLYLDKQAVTQPSNMAMQEELQVIEKQQSTGSLNVQPQSHFPHDLRNGGGSEKGRPVTRRSGASSAKFDRICRGSVANKLRRAKSGGVLGNSMMRGNCTQSRENPSHRAMESTELMIVGDRFAASSLMSPLLRTQTQFSLSNQRMTVNSPEIFGAFERLPPLEQVRISLRHMDAHGSDALGNRVASPYSTGANMGVMEDLKPFIKYSPDVRAQYNRQIKYY